MSEPTLAALAAVGAPLLKDAEAALAPEAEKVLTDLRSFVSGEADKLRTEFPAVVEQGVAHLHNLAEAMLSRYHSVMDRIDAHLGGGAPAPAASGLDVPVQQGPAIPVPSDGTPSATGVASNPASAQIGTPVVVGEPGPEGPAPVGPSAATPESPSTSTTTSVPSETSSESSATPSDVATPTATDTPAA